VAAPLASYGYEDEVYLPSRLRVSPTFALPTLRVEARASWLACKVECIPESAELALELPVRGGTGAPSADAEAIRAAVAAIPRPSTGEAWLVDLDRDSLLLRVELDGEVSPDAGFLFVPEIAGVIEPAADQPVEVVGRAVTLRLAKSSLAPEPVMALDGVLLTRPGGDGRPVDARGVTATAAPPPLASGSGETGLAVACGLAFVGGLALNLMPCVFPVLAIKVLGFARAAGASRARSVTHGLAFAIGILLSFWALAGTLLALKARGTQIGWGFQLQSPVFVLALVFLFFAMGLVFLGVVQIGGRVAAAAARLGTARGLAGSFWSGVLATAVATPCTAPFMGTALGYALGVDAASALAVFTSLALGMGMPYVVLSASPSLLRALPRPGAWMETLQQLLAFPLLATVVWLLWVYGRQVGTDALTRALGGLLLAAFGAWLAGRWGEAPAAAVRRLAWAAAGAAILGGVILALPGRNAGSPSAGSSAAAADPHWIPYTRQALSAELLRGRPVYVDFTAAWCLTCQLNKRVVFGSGAVLEAFERHDVALMRADWTHYDPEITRALASFGRSGVPLNVLYGGDPREAPTVLPTVLTPRTVLDALAGTVDNPPRNDRGHKESS
jgi:thiol:disulfide interchange protein DsbD